MFLNALGARQSRPEQLSLLGGTAPILLGSTRTTADIDYVSDGIRQMAFQQTIAHFTESVIEDKALVQHGAAEFHCYLNRQQEQSACV